MFNIIQLIDMFIKDLKKLKKEIEKQEKFISQQHQKLGEMKAELEAVCHHPKQYVKLDEFYYSGDYLNKAYTTTTPYCSICGMRGDSYTKTESYYG